MSRNINDALIDVVEEINVRGDVVESRGGQQREIVGALVTIDRPRERILTVPNRNNNVFAQVAETIWVLAGRNDLDFLGRFLPRAHEFSDDGETWRAAYGPRLRAWGPGKVDQLAAVRNRLQEDPHTKRAVATIFDPALDNVETLDVPCNNWLHFLQRDGILALNVSVRANDAIWGFSGINVFEWSVLHELMARTLGWSTGKMSWFVGTLHVYERHYGVAERIVRHRGIRSLYDFGIEPLSITIGLDQLDATLDDVFAVDALAREGADAHARAANDRISDPFFRAVATLLRAHHALVVRDDLSGALSVIDELPVSDLRLAALEYLSRRAKSTDLPLRQGEREYLGYLWAMRDAAAALVA